MEWYSGDFASHDEVKAQFAKAHYTEDTVFIHVNAVLVKMPDRTLMIDMGSGGVWGPTSGYLDQHLENAGFKPEDITDIIITANWDADSSNRWTVPLGGGVGKLLKIGKQAINVRTEAYYNVEKPDSAPDWQWGFTIQFLFPK